MLDKYMYHGVRQGEDVHCTQYTVHCTCTLYRFHERREKVGVLQVKVSWGKTWRRSTVHCTGLREKREGRNN